MRAGHEVQFESFVTARSADLMRVASLLPAGPALLEQVVAARVGGALAVGAPASATSATVLASDGTTITTLPLVTGSGVTDLLPAPAPVATRVRVLDAAGAVLAEAPVAGTAG